MGQRQFSNNGSSLTASLISAADTQVTLSSGDGAKFPAPTGGNYAMCTLEDVSGNIEIVKMTGRAGDICTIVRAQEGTTALSFPSGSRFELRVTKGVLDSFVQKDGDSITGIVTMSGAGKISGGAYENGIVRGSPIRGADDGTANEFVVPSGAGAPTIGGNVVYHAGNLTIGVLNPIVYKTGMIMMWYGALGQIPTGWALCDGTNGTPDLRDRFVVGAGLSYGLGAVGGQVSQSTSAAGGHTHTITGTALTVSQLPAHSHRLHVVGFVSNSTVDGVLNPGAAVAGEIDGGKLYTTNDGTGVPVIESTGSGDAHSHGMDTQGDHTHTVDVRPPYMGIYFIMKL